VVRRIFEHVKDPKKIAWWSMGGFRTNPALKKFLKRDKAHLALFAQEDMIFGEDGKFRYFRPIRVGFYRAIQDEIAMHAPETVLYLCMENEDVWKEADMLYRIPNGLPEYLDRRATALCRYTSNAKER
jgi:spore photoproduct lyase